jgi:hypothetical protein
VLYVQFPCTGIGSISTARPALGVCMSNICWQPWLPGWFPISGRILLLVGIANFVKSKPAYM